jgi:hypothetical protein
MRDHSQPTPTAAMASARYGIYSSSISCLLKSASRITSRRYIMPQAIRMPPAKRCGRNSRLALRAITTVVTVEE